MLWPFGVFHWDPFVAHQGMLSSQALLSQFHMPPPNLHILHCVWKGASSRRVYSGANLLLRLDILGTDLGTPQNLMSVMKMLVPLGWYTFIINPPITPYIVGTIPKGTTILPDWWLGNQASSMGCLDFREKHGIHYISIGAGFLASTVLSQFWPTQRKRVRKKFDM